MHALISTLKTMVVSMAACVGVGEGPGLSGKRAVCNISNAHEHLKATFITVKINSRGHALSLLHKICSRVRTVY